MPIINTTYGADNTPSKGLIFTEYNADGRPSKAELIGNWTDVPSEFFRGLTEYSTTWLSLLKNAHIPLPDTIKHIDTYAFQKTDGVFSGHMPNNVESIATFAFDSTLWDTVTLPSSLVTLTGDALRNMNATKFIFEGQVPNLPSDCFWSNGKCLLYDFRNCTTVPTCARLQVFGGINANCKIVVPDALYDEWISSTVWSDNTLASKIIKASDYTG